jgi:type VI secretion system protein ImpG
VDPRLLRYYNQELAHLREMGAEFAREFPKIAARLGMDGIEVTDPYVERLMEGVAFLASRVQLRLDCEFPRFTQRLLEIVYPGFLAPMPAMLVAQLSPDLNDPNLARGFRVARGSALRKVRGERAAEAAGKGALDDDRAPIEFRTAHEVTLWPLELTAAQYFSYAPDLPLTALPVASRVRGGVRLRLKCGAGLTFSQLALDGLRLFLTGNDEVAYRLYELLLGAPLGIVVAPAERPWRWYRWLSAENIRAVGYRDEEAALPVAPRMFQGYRLLQEYFAFPQRFLFVELGGLAPAVRGHKADELEVVLLLERGDAALEQVVDRANFALHCTPAINLFPKRADRIHVAENVHEYHVVPDRTHPLDYEVFQLTSVIGHGGGRTGETEFLPFYAAFHTEGGDHGAYYTLERRPRLLSESQKRNGFRSSYIGAEVFLSLVDAQEAPFRGDLRQLAIGSLCTNRDLPLMMALGHGRSDFALETAAPVTAIRALKGPSRPCSPVWERGAEWKFINHLALSYLSLTDSSPREGAAALRQLLGLYAATSDPAAKRQIEGVRSVRSQQTVRRLPATGPIAFGRGVRVEVEVEELAFQGASAFLFGCVLERFLARHVSINSFTETVLRAAARGEIKRWVPRWGDRAIL